LLFRRRGLVVHLGYWFWVDLVGRVRFWGLRVGERFLVERGRLVVGWRHVRVGHLEGDRRVNAPRALLVDWLRARLVDVEVAEEADLVPEKGLWLLEVN
jgi:hypothetical protein